jgi:hypothetical protein
MLRKILCPSQALMPALDLIAAWARDNLPPGDC